jgi:hypothetical protein
MVYELTKVLTQVEKHLLELLTHFILRQKLLQTKYKIYAVNSKADWIKYIIIHSIFCSYYGIKIVINIKRGYLVSKLLNYQYTFTIIKKCFPPKSAR